MRPKDPAEQVLKSLGKSIVIRESKNLATLDQNIEDRLSSLGEPLPKSLRATKKSSRPILTKIDLSDPAGVDEAPIPNAKFLEQESVDVSHTATHRIQCESGDIWISGNALLCSCPDCAAPMTVRLWLRLADCWRCDASISLSEEQLRAARQLSELPKPARTNVEAAASSTVTLPPPPPPAPTVDLPPPPPLPFGSPVDVRERELEMLSRGSAAARWVRSGFRITPAWMVSFILHLIIILILALIMMGDNSIIPSSITLSSFLSSDDEEGGEIRMEEPLDALQDDLRRALDMDVSDRELRKVLQKANQDALELQIDSSPRVPLPEIKEVRKNITTRKDKQMSFAARDPRVRAEIVRKEGGTTMTEAAVSRGLRWLTSVQNKDGGWSLNDYRYHARESTKSDIMGTSLALLPLLGAGQTHEFGTYKDSVASGLAWMIKNQKPNGDLRAGFDGQAGMYAHGQGAIVLCEALALTGDQKLLEPAQNAIRFIELAQHSRGGWRYRPGQVGDTSVFGWQMMALQSARAPDMNLKLDDSTLKLADYFLESVTAPAKFKRGSKLPEGSAYGYQPSRDATAAMTAEAILCRMYLGWKRDDPRLSQSVKWLIKDHLPSLQDPNLYYWYYGTQVMHHYGGDPWEKWNDKMRGLLISTQETRGRYPGSWNPANFEWGSKGGRIYTTSLAVCTLEVYYRHLPLFKQIELDE